MNKLLGNKKGAAALLTIIIIGAATLAMALGASLLSLGDLEMSVYSDGGARALFLADGCLEEALRRLKKDANYVGSSLSFGGGSCIITVAPAGGDKAITISATYGEYARKIEAGLSISESVLTLNYWRTVNF